MCAGITTFNALRESVARPGDVVAILGVGGLGHLGIQFAAKMGFEVVAIARGNDKEPLAKKLGAHHYIDSKASDVAEELNKLGGAQVVLATVTVADAMTATLGGLKARGQLVVVGAPNDPLQVPGAALIFKSSAIQGHASGTSQDSEDTLRFSALTGVRPMIETVPLSEAQAAYDKMMSGAARFRMVLDDGLTSRRNAKWRPPFRVSATWRARSERHLTILVTRPAPTVRPPSRIAKRRPSSMATGWISFTEMSVLSPGITISVPSGSVTTPVTSVVRK